MEKFLRITNKDSDSVSSSAGSSSAGSSSAGSSSAGSSSDFEPPCKRKKSASEVWKHFEKCKNKMFAKCRLCGKEYKTSGNTTNLSDHLKHVHPLKTAVTADNLSKIDDFVSRSEAYAPTSTKKTVLDKGLAQMVASDVQPFSIVDGVGFRNFVRLLDPKYVLPSRTTLQHVHTKNMYDETVVKLKSKLNAIEHCSITTDCWTSRANTNFITVTCHFIDDFKLKSAVLATQPLLNESNHCSNNIAETVKNICDEFVVFDKIETVVTDNAASMKKACELMQKKHLGCFAHSLNLIVQESLAIKNVQSVLKCVKSIVTYFKSSSIAYANLKKAQNTAKPLSLIQEVPTRWNSAFHMLKRVLLIREAICSVLLTTSKAPLPLTEDQFLLIEDICAILEPFETATLNTSASKTVTISLIIPTTLGLLIKLDNLKPKTKTIVGAETCSFLTTKLKSRLSPYETRTVTRMATILDPRFKKEGFHNPANADQAVIALENHLASFINVQNLCTTEEPPTNTKNTDLYSFVAEKVQQKPKNNRANAIIELRQFFEQRNASQGIDPLEYWKINETQFGSLAQCANKYLSVPATSTESERAFSKAGEIVNEKRAALKPKAVNILLFLSKNQWLSDE
ncbi:zinc finger BED domain-containing protein 4-like [Drosophila obscura]|uniref:zinc finger BED domain-containing protein 4-like n=1 Tax=Drosophila obscura TaxID=7282 RepID=UPI001BB1584E|nr:zinc finger BED domain-containing protein 4-like [Drosophila obscura]